MSDLHAPFTATLHRPWLVALVALVLWFPAAPFLQSDDWIAIDHAADIGRVGQDFIGNQYGLGGLVWFYRPLITLSFHLDLLLSDGTPSGIAFTAHLSNACAFALATMLLALLATRLLGPQAAWPAALWFAVGPQHVGSISWAVGRVDSHTMVWMFAALLAWTKVLDAAAPGRRRLWTTAALGSFVLALGSKELAVVVPLLAALLGFALHPVSKSRLRAACTSWPLFLVLALYLCLRVFLFQRLGGYQGAAPDIFQSLLGLGQWTLRTLAPGTIEPLLPALPWLSGGRAILLSLPAAAALFVAVRGRPRMALMLLVAYLICCVPIAQFLAATSDLKNWRYFTVPSAAIALLLAMAPRGALLATVVALPVFVSVRLETHAAHQRARTLHERLVDTARSLPATPTPLFVAGLPRTDTGGRTVLFHLGVDRLLLPSGDGRPVHAFRPLSDRLDGHTLGTPFPLPDGFMVDLSETGPDAVVLAPGEQDGSFEVTLEGPLVERNNEAAPSSRSDEVLLDVKAFFDLHLGRASADFVMARPASHYRITVFTAGGYLAAILPDEATDPTRGRIPLLSWLTRGRHATGGDNSFVTLALDVPATLDRSPRFPILIEAGTMEGNHFTRQAMARRFLYLRLERNYAEFLAGRTPDPG